MTLRLPVYVVPGDELLATHITVIWIFTSINLNMLFKVVSEDELLVTQSTGIWIVPRMTLHVTLFMVPGDEILATQGTVLWIQLMCFFSCFLESNPFPHRAHCMDLATRQTVLW